MSFLYFDEHPLKSNLEISGCFFNFAQEKHYYEDLYNTAKRTTKTA
nr:MAG TPA: hypothetical protein [Caudoviricetes sp.]